VLARALNAFCCRLDPSPKDAFTRAPSLPTVSELNPLMIPLTGFEDAGMNGHSPGRMLSSNTDSIGSQPNKPEAEDVSGRWWQQAAAVMGEMGKEGNGGPEMALRCRWLRWRERAG
jgi:hypothetical protein